LPVDAHEVDAREEGVDKARHELMLLAPLDNNASSQIIKGALLLPDAFPHTQLKLPMESCEISQCPIPGIDLHRCVEIPSYSW
jgi:hypothetical protein